MDDELQFHLAAGGSLAKDGADVQEAEAADLQEVAEHARAAPFDGGRRDARHLHDVVGDQAVAAGDQFEGEFRFADAGNRR